VRITRGFAESLLAAAAASLLFLLSGLNFALGPLAAFFSPAPLIWVSYRRGPGGGLSAAALATAATLPLLHPPMVLSFFAGSALPGFLMGYLLRTGTGAVRTVLYAACASLLLSAGVSALYFAAAGLDPLPFLKYRVGDMLRETEYAMEALAGGPAETGSLLPPYFARTLPAVVFIAVFIQHGLNLLLVRLAIARVYRIRKAMPDMTRFAVPEYMVWGLIPALAAQWTPSSYIRTAALNCVIVMLFFYLLHGSSILSHFIGRMKTPPPFFMICVITFLLQPYLLALPLLAGLLDFRFHFRQRWGLPDHPP